MIKPLNLGQNKGKFNQLKSLLQSSQEQRVQTSDDLIADRANKQVLFDQTQNVKAQYGMTGFAQSYQQNRNKFTAGREEMRSTNFNMSLQQQHYDNLTTNERNISNKIHVEQNESLVLAGLMDYTDGNISPGNVDGSYEHSIQGTGKMSKSFINRVTHNREE